MTSDPMSLHRACVIYALYRANDQYVCAGMSSHVFCKYEETVGSRRVPGVWLQAQGILFSRYSEVLAPFKYAGYPMLLDAVALPDDEDDTSASSSGGNHFLSPPRAGQLQVSTLCMSTMVSQKRWAGLHLSGLNNTGELSK